jgi:hypothetical protein
MTIVSEEKLKEIYEESKLLNKQLRRVLEGKPFNVGISATLLVLVEMLDSLPKHDKIEGINRAIKSIVNFEYD